MTDALNDKLITAIRLWCADNGHLLVESELGDLATRIEHHPGVFSSEIRLNEHDLRRDFESFTLRASTREEGLLDRNENGDYTLLTTTAAFAAWRAAALTYSKPEREYRPHPDTPLALRIRNAVHALNLDRPDIAMLKDGSTISRNITDDRNVAALLADILTYIEGGS